MKLLTKALRKQLPPLYSTEAQSDPMVICKFFYPSFDWTWYAIEYDGQDVFFGLVDGLEVELGYFWLSELERVRGKLGLPVERDLYWEPITLDKLMEEKERAA